MKTLNASTIGIPNASATPTVISFNLDPSAGTGVAASVGSLGLRTDVPSVYVKIGSSDTAWSVLPPGTGPLAAIAYSGSASDLVSGTVPTAVMPAFSGDVTTSAGSTTTTIAAGAVTDTKLRNSSATSVIGRASNTSGSPADIVATADGQVLQRVAGQLTFAALSPGVLYDTVLSFTFSSFDNVNLGTLGANTFVRCTLSTGSNTITGISGGVDGKIVTLYRNDSATANIDHFSNDDSLSSTNNRILLSNATSMSWLAQSCKTFRYDGNLSRWVCLSSNAS